MSMVVSKIDIEKYKDKESVTFPTGTIITPTAKDYALEHKIKISVTGSFKNSETRGVEGIELTDRDKYLKLTVTAVIKEFEKNGLSLEVDSVVKATNTCLERLGCQII